jgi:hypothetical protein
MDVPVEQAELQPDSTDTNGEVYTRGWWQGPRFDIGSHGEGNR